MVLGERTGGMGMARGGAEIDGERRVRADAGIDQDGGGWRRQRARRAAAGA